MKNWLISFFSSNSSETGTATMPYITEYKGLSDFLRNAPEKEKIDVFTEAARRANEDQRKTLERAELTPSR